MMKGLSGVLPSNHTFSMCLEYASDWSMISGQEHIKLPILIHARLELTVVGGLPSQYLRFLVARRCQVSDVRCHAVTSSLSTPVQV